METNSSTIVGGVAVSVTGRLVKTITLRDEYYLTVDDPKTLAGEISESCVRADLFSFVGTFDSEVPRQEYVHEMDELAVLPLSTYANWFDNQIRYRARNKFRKALKGGVQTRVVPFTDELLEGIRLVYDESPLRQGKKNRHYGKDLETLRREHSTFLDRSEFIGAYYGEELVGFAKVTYCGSAAIIMNFMGKIAYRDKCANNALLAKVIELVTVRNVRHLNYGIWGRRGLNEFKASSGFECHRVPRYFVPLTGLGKLAIALKLHRGLRSRIPEPWIIRAAEWRDRLNALFYNRAAAEPTRGTEEGRAATSVAS